MAKVLIFLIVTGFFEDSNKFRSMKGAGVKVLYSIVAGYLFLKIFINRVLQQNRFLSFEWRKIFLYLQWYIFTYLYNSF